MEESSEAERVCVLRVCNSPFPFSLCVSVFTMLWKERCLLRTQGNKQNMCVLSIPFVFIFSPIRGSLYQFFFLAKAPFFLVYLEKPIHHVCFAQSKRKEVSVEIQCVQKNRLERGGECVPILLPIIIKFVIFFSPSQYND